MKRKIHRAHCRTAARLLYAVDRTEERVEIRRAVRRVAGADGVPYKLGRRRDVSVSEVERHVFTESGVSRSSLVLHSYWTNKHKYIRTKELNKQKEVNIVKFI